MPPSRKSRSAYKRFSNLNEVSPDKDGGSSKSGRPRVSPFFVSFLFRRSLHEQLRYLVVYLFVSNSSCVEHPI